VQFPKAVQVLQPIKLHSHLLTLCGKQRDLVKNITTFISLSLIFIYNV